MTVDEAQHLFDILGPEWRVFRYDQGRDEPAFDFTTARVLVTPFVDPDYFGIKMDTPQMGVLHSAVSEPAVVLSSPRGHLLRGDHPDGDLYEFSTITLTPARLAALKEPGIWSR